LEDLIVIVQHFLIGKSDDVIPEFLQLSCAESVVSGLLRIVEVMITVKLDDESVLGTDEIEDKWPHGLLPPEFQTIELAASEA
jgi:hypothetical protein